MLKYKCLVLDHDDTVVQTLKTLSYPFWCLELEQFRPGTTMTLSEYVTACHHWGFADMCRKCFGFTDDELAEEHRQWMEYVMKNIPEYFPGIDRVIRRQKAEGGLLCVVSHSSDVNILRDYRIHFGLEPDAIYSWDLPEHLRKPSTYALEDVMEKYGFSREEMLVVDDMKPAYEMASNAGVPIAFAAWGRKDYPEIAAEMRAICDYSFDSTEELERFLFEDELI